MDEAFALENVFFSYASGPKEAVLSGITCSIARGEFTAIVGATGSGKSTLLYAMGGVVPHLIPGTLRGLVRAFGAPLRGGPAARAGMVGILLQDPDAQLFAPTVREEALYGLQNLGVPKADAAAKADAALATVGMADFAGRDPQDLSFGQKQKVALAGVLAMGPAVLLLDEPVSALDGRSARDLYGLLGSLNRAGTTIVVVEHNTELVAEHARRALLLSGGNVVADGKPEDVLSLPLAAAAGIRVPCATEIARELGLGKAATPAALIELLRRRK